MRWVAEVLLIFCGATAAAQAVSEVVPEKLQTCIACHSENATSVNPAWPLLNGQNATYLAEQIRSFKNGTRTSPEMAPFVQTLSEEDIAQLAQYYSNQPVTIAANGDSALVAAGRNLSGYCTACHGANGRPAEQTWPNLAGQNAAYAEGQLLAFKSSRRTHPAMQAAIVRFDEAQIAALAAYYSQLNP